jgi:UDP-glucose 4-epimerase
VNDLVYDLSLFIQHEVSKGAYNLVSKNISILEIVDVFKELRPSLEFLFVDQHLDLRNIQVDTNLKLASLLELAQPRELKEEMEEFLENFSY